MSKSLQMIISNKQDIAKLTKNNLSIKHCENPECGTSKTPLWRKGWMKDGRKVRLCNACGLHYRKGHYCSFCNQIYRANYEIDSKNPLLCCEICKFTI